MKKHFQAPWTIKDILSTSSISISLLIIISLIFDKYAFNDILERTQSKSMKLVISFSIQWLIILIPVLMVTNKKHKISKKIFGLKFLGFKSSIQSTISAYLMFIGINIIISTFILFTNIKIPGYQIQELILSNFIANNLDIIITGIIVIIIAPFVEELFFRGFILRSLVNKTGTWIGSIITATFFALSHFQWQNIIQLFILGIILNTIVIRKKSIISSFFFHAFVNALAFSFEILIIKEVINIDYLIK